MGACFSSPVGGDASPYGSDKPARPLAALGPLQVGQAVFVTLTCSDRRTLCSAPYMVKGSSWMSFAAAGFLVSRRLEANVVVGIPKSHQVEQCKPEVQQCCPVSNCFAYMPYIYRFMEVSMALTQSSLRSTATAACDVCLYHSFLKTVSAGRAAAAKDVSCMLFNIWLFNIWPLNPRPTTTTLAVSLLLYSQNTWNNCACLSPPNSAKQKRTLSSSLHCRLLAIHHSRGGCCSSGVQAKGPLWTWPSWAWPTHHLSHGE